MVCRGECLYLKNAPRLILRVVPSRVLLPKGLIIISFGLLFLVIALVNDVLFPNQVSGVIYAVLAVATILGLCLESVWTYLKFHQYQYEFYSDHILVRGITTYPIAYEEIATARIEKNLFDRMSNTTTLVLEGPEHRYFIRSVVDDSALLFEAQRLIHVGRRSGSP
jgi:hypothetical protein